MSMVCKEKSYKFSKILQEYLANIFLPPVKRGFYII